ncbi:ABC transporter substrate-binding protein [Vibrio sp.]|nr:ABC transporter substrate-binding protein [Vibrio sp.]
MAHELNVDWKIADIVNAYPESISVFIRFGLDALVSESGLNALGPFLSLSTALHTRKIDEQEFVNALTSALQKLPELEAPGLDSTKNQSDLTLLALMPCGLKVPFSRDVSSFMSELTTLDKNLDIKYAVEGNLNQELSYYSYVPQITSPDELPDIIVSSDFNTFYGHDFQQKFVNNGIYTGYGQFELSPSFKEAGISDPMGRYSVLGVNPLVIVVNKDQLQGRPEPTSWADLLHPRWRASITLRGGNEFFCHAVLLPTYLRHGNDGLKALADNVRQGLHPSQMVKQIDKNAPGAIYVMPEFFAHRVKNQQRLNIVWPQEGALASPVTLQVKSAKIDQLKPILDYLVGENLAKTLGSARFPVPHAQVVNDVQSKPLMWLGWDFLRSRDLLSVNSDIDKVFLQRAIDAISEAHA